ncbi:PspC domain-containing protein [Flavobacterium sp.]|uniref:PspC domain-containing protein n=1 Tax=Flavobacterium sp. TaxID=239 RepID=UPI002B4B596D|nr:PspC domain-containing protein [Flavobacterium sp.]HLP62979.1 PspC domain-containing protein [Flavobacterium sp.]
MNKTVNINIGGLFFHIDEDAFQKLSRYFDAIKRSLSNSSGKDEIMKDIEMRVAELFTERQKSDKHVINIKDVDEVVTVMGQPEDYRIDDDGDEKTQTNFSSPSGKRKLYRDQDKGLIGGVCTGLGHYFGIDAVWIKIFFIILVLAGFGTGILAYIILWIVTPAAITTTEKLEMTGEPVNISNIERKVREEFENVSSRLKNADFDKMGNQIRSTTESAGNKIGDALTSIFGALAKVLGALIMVFSAISLFGICIAAVVLMFSSSLPENTIFNHISTPIGFETPLWIQGLLFLFAFGIPMFFILYLGLKLLITNLKSIGSIVKYGLLAIWVVAVGILISLGLKEFGQIAHDGKVVKKEIININPNDTLFVKFKNNDFYSKNVNEHDDFRLTQDEAGNPIIYSNDVRLEVMITDEPMPYLQIEKLAHGKSGAEAKQRAEKIKYSYKIEGNKIILDNYLLTEIRQKFREQNVEVYLYLPKGTIFKADSSVKNFDYSDDSIFNLHHSGEYTYKVADSQIKCLNCPVDENEHGDIETEEINLIEETDSSKTISIKVNGKEVQQIKTGKSSLEYSDKEGKIIKIN